LFCLPPTSVIPPKVSSSISNFFLCIIPLLWMLDKILCYRRMKNLPSNLYLSIIYFREVILNKLLKIYINFLLDFLESGGKLNTIQI
jgi:hypothetical protein